MGSIKALVNGEYVPMPYYAAHWYAGEADLNFAVIGGTSTPSNPVENTVWVNTDTDIKDWQFSETQPSERTDGTPLSGGEVWFSTGLNTKIKFNALKKHNITVSPNGCKQYIDGVWVDKIAMIYQSSVWIDFRTCLFLNGDECTDLTGGWKTTGMGVNAAIPNVRALTIAKLDSAIMASQTAEDRCGILYTAKKIDLTNYTKLHAICARSSGSSISHVELHIWSQLGSYVSTYEVASAYLPEGECGLVTIDVGELTGAHVVGFSVYNAPNSVTMQSMWLT